MPTRVYIAALVAMMDNAVLFGAGAILVLSVPALSVSAAYLLPIVSSFVIAPFLGWMVAPHLQAKWPRLYRTSNQTSAPGYGRSHAPLT